jgi:hypothetical protein
MAIFNGRYSWSGKKEDQHDPIAWFPGAYDIKIVDLSVNNSGVTYLRPYLCIYKSTGQGHCISANPEKFAKRICIDFSLDIEKVLWVEQDKEVAEKFEVVIFKKCGNLHQNTFFQFEKRKPTPREMTLISRQS